MTRRIPCVAAWTVLAALALGAAAAAAKDLGVRGATWPIAEPDLLADIEARLTFMERSGELARLEDEARKRAQRSLEQQEPVPGIVPATEHRARAFDPAIVVAQDILGPDGEILAAAGARIDPFEHLTLTADVLFVDGRREAEVAWALARERPAKIVLLAGRPLDLMRRHGRPFYFDLGGRLAERFAIRATPTVLAAGAALDGEKTPGRGQSPDAEHAKSGNRLLLTEIPVRDRPPAGCAPPSESIPQPTDRRQPPC
ncbi:MAG: type-F conjugative transfer system protein TraW [Gammaproteobacteria bacterium]|nr:type-F conjugative transfer system protein TraW [Gammaproteobacteria bacterium]MYB12872.1 type-F conjugative transfer system protein TraW [Rhodospirillaceae bacterium]MYI24549.1 type-F conjugative transfer system protein TraW [Gammaproteobacteria bacterium]